MKTLSNLELQKIMENLNFPNYIPKLKIEEIKKILRKIIFYKNEDNNLDFEFLNTIGNNHKGVYYSELYFILDFLILLLNNSKNNRAKLLLAILNNLAYFEFMPKNKDEEELGNYIKEKLHKFNDEFIFK